MPGISPAPLKHEAEQARAEGEVAAGTAAPRPGAEGDTDQGAGEGGGVRQGRAVTLGAVARVGLGADESLDH